MRNCNALVKFKDYGKIVLRLSEIMDKMGVTRNRVSRLTGIKYSVVDRYYRADNVERVDLDILARICYTLGCDLCDILKYET